jgi:hypothetical protein
MLNQPPWKIIGQYRNVQLPPLPIPTKLPHKLGHIPDYIEKTTTNGRDVRAKKTTLASNTHNGP